MSKLKILIGLGMVLASFATATSPASAWFFGMKAGNCTSTEVNVCGTNLTPITFTVGTSVVTCAAETALVEKWTIQKSEESQGEVQEGGHLQIVTSCKGTAKVGGGEALPAELSSCSLQLAQAKGQTTNVTGKVFSACTVKAANGFCVVTVPPEGNQGLGFSELKDTEKGKGLMETLVTSAITGVTAEGKGLCGFTKSKEGKLAVAGLDIWDVLWV